MKRLLYVLSKPINNQPRLIGKLAEQDGEYTFEYTLGKTLPEWFLILDEFPDIRKTYRGREVRPFVERLTPRPNDFYIKLLLENAGLQEYDEWALLKAQGGFNPRQDAYLYENLPMEAIIYERMGVATARTVRNGSKQNMGNKRNGNCLVQTRLRPCRKDSRNIRVSQAGINRRGTSKSTHSQSKGIQT
jgi:hypothetical protein